MAHKKNWAVYHRLFRQAAKLEKSGAEDAALEIYREIVDDYWPIGAEYYRRPALILEKKGDPEGALLFVRYAVMNHLDMKDNAEIMNEFVPWLNRILDQLGQKDSVAHYFVKRPNAQD